MSPMGRNTKAVKDLVEAYQQATLEFHRYVGGWPDEVEVVLAESLIIASADENGEPHLVTMPLAEALAKFELVKKGLKDGTYADLMEAFGEQGL
jgi:hypothetical protein